MHDGKDVKEAKCPIFFISVPGDAYFDEAKVQSCRDAGAPVKVFEGLHHGFMVRGDFKNNAVVKAAADEAIADVIAFFNKHIV